MGSSDIDSSVIWAVFPVVLTVRPLPIKAKDARN